MNVSTVTVVRIYMHERDGQLERLLETLREQEQVRGMTVFRGISGFGESGVQSVKQIDLSLSLPIVVEFFDQPAKVERVLEQLGPLVKPGHMLSWSAQVNE